MLAVAGLFFFSFQNHGHFFKRVRTELTTWSWRAHASYSERVGRKQTCHATPHTKAGSWADLWPCEPAQIQYCIVTKTQGPGAKRIGGLVMMPAKCWEDQATRQTQVSPWDPDLVACSFIFGPALARNLWVRVGPQRVSLPLGLGVFFPFFCCGKF